MHRGATAKLLLREKCPDKRVCCAAVGLTIYMVAQQLVLNYCRKLRHFESLYFASVANNILWWTFVKACFNVVWGLIGGECQNLRSHMCPAHLMLPGRTLVLAPENT